MLLAKKLRTAGAGNQRLERDSKWNFDVRRATHLEGAREGASARCCEAPMGRIPAEDFDSSGKCDGIDFPETQATDAESLRNENKRLRELLIHLWKLVLAERKLRQLCDIDRDAPVLSYSQQSTL